MPITAVLLDGVTVHLEIDGLETPVSLHSTQGMLTDRALEETGVTDRIADVGDELRRMLRAVVKSAKQSLEDAQPNEWSVELNIGFKGEAGIPCLTKGEANAAFKVTAKWKQGG